MFKDPENVSTNKNHRTSFMQTPPTFGTVDILSVWVNVEAECRWPLVVVHLRAAAAAWDCFLNMSCIGFNLFLSMFQSFLHCPSNMISNG